MSIATSRGTGLPARATVALLATAAASLLAHAGPSLSPTHAADADPRAGASVAQSTLPQVRVRLYEGVIEGIGEPSRPVTITVTSRGLPGPLVWQTRTEADGGFGARLLPATSLAEPPCAAEPSCYVPLPLAPGDRVAVELASGDPVVLTLPALTTRTDPDAETVGGTATGGAAVEIYDGLPWPRRSWDIPPPGSNGPGRHLATVVAAGDGAWAATLSPALDIEPPRPGYTVVALQGHRIAAQWRPLVVDLTQNDGYLSATGVAGRPISATLRAADGRLLARLDTHRDAGPLLDAVGERPAIGAGDVLDIQRGDDRLALRIPRLDGRVHVEDDVLFGQGPPAEAVRILGGPSPVVAVVDGTGLFRHDFKADGVDLRYNDVLRAELAFGPGRRHTLRRDLALPGLMLALHTAQLRGSSEPLLDLSIRTERGAATLARQTVRADGRAAFRTTLAGADGRRLALAPGDRLTVEAPPTALQRLVTMAVPPLDIDLEASADRAAGRMPPDASLSLSLSHWFITGADANVRGWEAPSPDTLGAWTATFASSGSDPADIRPGSAIDAELRLPSGHVVEHRVALPLLSAQVDGTRVCGQAAPLADVRVTADDAAGAAVLTGTGTADPFGRFAFALVDVDGLGRTMTPGTRVRGRLGGDDVALVVPPLGVEVDWPSGAVALTTAPRAEVTVEVGAFGCLGRGTGGGSAYDSRFGRADEAGRAAFDDFLADHAAAGVVAAAFTADGMRAYREARRLVADLYVDTPQVVVTTTALTRVRAELHTAGGTSNGAFAVTDDAGRASLALADTAGRPVHLEAGQTLYLFAGVDEARIVVEPLSFDVSPGRGIAGMAAPGRDVAHRLTLTDGRIIAFHRTADDRGRFVFTPSMVPPRSAWRWADVRRAEGAILLAGGHRVVSDVVLEAGAGEVLGRIWLPYGGTGGRR